MKKKNIGVVIELSISFQGDVSLTKKSDWPFSLTSPLKKEHLL